MARSIALAAVRLGRGAPARPPAARRLWRGAQGAMWLDISPKHVQPCLTSKAETNKLVHMVFAVAKVPHIRASASPSAGRLSSQPAC
jgi:hypothetical protein